MALALLQAVAMMAIVLADLGATFGATSLDGGLARLFLVTLLGLLGVGFCWALLLATTRWVTARLRGEDLGAREPAVGWGAGEGGLAEAVQEREEPSFGRGRLSQGIVPAPATAAAAASSKPGIEGQQPSSSDGARAPADPANDGLPMHHVRLARLPHPQPLGAVESARPEWTGAVVPTSLEETGAVEVARVSVHHEPAAKTRGAARAIDYRISALPRVDATGQRRPNMLVYTALDRGLVARASAAPLRRRG